MATGASHRPFLDQALEAYRAGAKAWSRDALLSALLLLFAGVFVVAPFLDWSALARTVAGEREQVRATQARVVAGERGIERLLGALAEARAAAATTAETLAADLSQRLRRFADLARRLDERAAPPAPGLIPPDGELPPPVQAAAAQLPGRGDRAAIRHAGPALAAAQLPGRGDRAAVRAAAPARRSCCRRRC